MADMSRISMSEEEFVALAQQRIEALQAFLKYPHNWRKDQVEELVERTVMSTIPAAETYCPNLVPALRHEVDALYARLQFRWP